MAHHNRNRGALIYTHKVTHKNGISLWDLRSCIQHYGWFKSTQRGCSQPNCISVHGLMFDVWRLKFDARKCDQSVKRKPDLQQHIQRVHSQKEQCGICSRYVQHKNSLARHIRNQHLEAMPDSDEEEPPCKKRNTVPAATIAIDNLIHIHNSDRYYTPLTKKSQHSTRLISPQVLT